MTEFDKMMQAREDGSQTIGEFLEWLEIRGYVIAEWDQSRRFDYRLTPTSKTIEQWLAEYFEVDLGQLEQERKAALEEIRAQQPRTRR